MQQKNDILNTLLFLLKICLLQQEIIWPTRTLRPMLGHAKSQFFLNPGIGLSGFKWTFCFGPRFLTRKMQSFWSIYFLQYIYPTPLAKDSVTFANFKFSLALTVRPGQRQMSLVKKWNSFHLWYVLQKDTIWSSVLNKANGTYLLIGTLRAPKVLGGQKPNFASLLRKFEELLHL